MNYSIDKEIWKEIEGYEGLYEVSNFGNVRSLDRLVEYTGKRSGTLSKMKGKPLKPYGDGRGYLKVKLGRTRSVSVHRLVAEAFIPKVKGKDIINHIDNNRINNIVSNLEWVTPKENVHHAMKQGRMRRKQRTNE